MTNPIVRRTGSFSVVKQLDPTTLDGSVDADAPFSGTYTCRYAGDVVREGTWSVAGTGRPPSPRPQTACPPPPCAPRRRPTGRLRTRRRLLDLGHAVVSDPTTVEAVDAPAEVTVTNTPTRVYAPFSITKVYEGPAAALVPGADVAGAWSCDYAGAQVDAGRWRLPADGGSVDIALRTDAIRGERPDPAPGRLGVHVVEDTPARRAGRRAPTRGTTPPTTRRPGR